MHLYSPFPCRRQLTAPKCFSSWHTPRDAVCFHSLRTGTNTPQCFCILWGRARSPGGLSLQLNKRWDPGFYMPLKPAAGCVMPGKATCTTPSIHPASLNVHIAHSSGPSHYPSTLLSRKKKKSKQAIFLFLLNGGSIHSDILLVHSYPLIAFTGLFLMKEEKEHLLLLLNNP